MELQVFQVPKAAMNELGILTACSGSEVPLLDEADLERHRAAAGSQGEIANDSGSIDSAPQDEHIERRFSEALNLLGARVRHSVTSLEDAAPKNISRIRQPRAGTHARYEK